MDKKELEAKLEEQRSLGHPNFKNKIVEILVNEFNIELDIAKKTVFKSLVEDKIEKDMAWSQHMGPNFWATTIIENDFLYKTHE